MSRFIDDQELKKFARLVIDGSYSAIKFAEDIHRKITDHEIYVARAECDCPVNCCKCYLPFESKPDQIQAGDTFRQITPNGHELTLGALGVRHPAEGVTEIFTAGWPAMIVRIPDHGRVELVRKGTGITKAELRHRRERGWGDWEDGL